MSLGSRFDAWLTTQPESPDPPLPGEPGYPACACGAFLRREPDTTEGKELAEPCPGHGPDGCEAPCGEAERHEPHEFVAHAWGENHHKCRKCGQDNVIIDA